MRARTCAMFAFGLISLALDLGVARGDIVNGGFETGDLTGWTRQAYSGGFQDLNTTPHLFQSYVSGSLAGTAAVDENAAIPSQATSFGGGSGIPIGPTAGNYMAFISNELSLGSITGSSISQSFVVNPGATSISFDVLFLSDEVIDSHWDFGGVALLQGSTILAQYNLDHDTVSDADAHATATPMGGFADSTPWISSSFSLAGLSGQAVTFVAYVTNNADQSVESRLLLDNVQVNGGAVPEPTSFALTGIAVAMLVGYRRLSRR